MPLTKKSIERANKRRKYSDGRGLFLSVSRTGSKTWAYCYRFPAPDAPKGYREREMGLGSIDWMTLEEAREKATDLRRMVRQGIDPMTERDRDTRAAVRQTRDGSTFQQIADRFIDMKKAEWDAGGRSENSWRGSFANHVYPKVGAKLITDIDRLDVRDLLLPLWTTVTTTATRLLPRIEEVFEFAIAEGLRSGENPANRTKVRKLLPDPTRVYSPKRHKALPYSALPPFLATVRSRDGIAPRALEFLILTAARTSEVIGATWDEIDLDAAVWTIPASRMKIKKHRSGEERAPHRVPLSGPALALLRALLREQDNPFVFVSVSKSGRGLSNMAMLKLLKDDLGYDGEATVHGFRAAFRTWVAEATDYTEDLAEQALAHEEEDKVKAAYKRTDLFAKRVPMMRDWAAFVGGAANAA